MIAYLEGKLLSKEITFAVIENHGVGYQIFMPTKTLANLGSLGKDVSVWTQMIVREDEISLYGFENRGEKDLFEKLLGVSGVGPKVALAMLSTLTPSQLVEAVESEDITSITAVPGIGKKGAQRIILELKGKLPGVGGVEVGEGTSSPGLYTEAIQALVSMGFTESEVRTALKGFEGQETDIAGAIKHALQRLGAK